MELASFVPKTQYAAPRAAAAGPPAAELRGVSKSFGDLQAARDLDLEIAPGEFLSFLGPSGCGKTTALRMLAGFETPTSGEVLIGGAVVTGLAPHRRPVNMVFQSYALFPHLTVEQNIAFGLRQRRPKPDAATVREKVGRALETVRLPGFGARRIWEMSGGQQQRVALARAIVNQPRLLLLDEPLAALDRKLRKEMQVELQDLQRALGITFVLVTHDQEEALSLSDRICVMRAGRIVQTGAPQALYDHPETRYVADFVGTSNFFEGRIAAIENGLATLRLAGGETLRARATARIAAGAEGCVSIRPEQVPLSRTPVDGAIAVTVHNRIFLGEHTEYVVQSDRLGALTVLSPRQTERAGGAMDPGDQAWVVWDPEAALALEND